MKKILLLGVGIATLFAFNIVDGKTYDCKTNGVSFSDGNQTRNIPLTPKTEPLLKKTLKNFYEIKFVKHKKEISLKIGNDEGNVTYTGQWRGYDRYEDKGGAVIFMPDKNASTKNAALIIPSQKVVIFYKCQ
jgi:hypothetical protein